MTNEPVIMERTYDAPVEQVWEALTDLGKMKQWYFDIAEFKPEVGFEFSFLAGDKTQKYLHLCKITDVIPQKKLAYTWRYDGYAGDSHLTFELFPDGDNKTKLKLTHKGLESLAAAGQPFARENFVKGWNYFINEALKDFVEKQTV